MGKKCVLWAKPVLVTLTLAMVVGLQWSDRTLSAQSSPDPLTLPRLAFADLTYVGGFRLPRAKQGIDSFAYGGQHLAYNPARNSLFGSSLQNNVAEVTIPAPVSTADVNQMPFATYLQGFSDPSEGHFREIEQGGPNGAVMAGLLVDRDRLYATGSIYYDASNSQVVSHFSHSTNLSAPSYLGMSQVWETGKAGFVGGYMATIPSEWHSLLGGPALTGQCCIPIVGRTSYGPAAFGFDPAGLGNNTAVPAAPLLYYPSNHTTLGPWLGANPTYGATTSMGGVAVIAGTRTALFIGRNGMGTYCYGEGVNDPALHGTTNAAGQINCYDPANGDKGQHAYPYRYQIWAYDLADFAAVRAGTKQPWEVVPYGVWPFELPTPGRIIEIGGVAYDAQRQLLYLAQYRADTDGYSERPIIHTLKINVPSSSVAPPALSTTVSLTPDVAAPKAPGSLIRWSAAATGGKEPYEYKWAAYANGTWSVVRDWSAPQTLDWQPATAAQDARMAVWVRTAPSALNSGDFSADSIAAVAEYPFPIVDALPEESPAPSSAVSSVALTTNLAAPQPASTPITWTATPTGGSGALVYKWFVTNDGGTWNAVGPWTSSSQFTWTPTVANAKYSVSVWVKHATNSADAAEASTYRPFAITEALSVPVASVALAANLTAPQPAGSSIVWTATPTGGTGALVYKWLISSDGATWNAVGSWTSSNQFTWTPTVANANHRISVWVKRASNPNNEWEATSAQPFAISEPSFPVSSVALTTDLPAPQEVSSTIVWTATPTGGTGALVFKWFVTTDGATWNAVDTWTSSNQFSWTPAVASANHGVTVWVKRVTNPVDGAEALAQQSFAIQDPVTSVALTTNLASPQPLSSTIEWTATPTGGAGDALVYKWFVSNDDGVTWTDAGPWNLSNRMHWTPTAVYPKYRVTVWVKHATDPSDYPEASAQRRFAIKK